MNDQVNRGWITGPGVKLTIHLHGCLKKWLSREKFSLAYPLALVYKNYAKVKREA
jgi:hypothetical protein